LQPGEFEDLFNALYFLWSLGSLALNCSLRRYGFYQGRPLLESCIPAQITALGIGAAKYFQLAVLALSEDFYVFSLLLSALLALLALHTSCAFLSILHGKHDILVTLGSYYVWLVMYQLPLGVTVLGIDVDWDLTGYVGVAVGAAIAGTGAGYVAYERATELEAEEQQRKAAFAQKQGRDPDVMEDTPMVGT